MLLVWWIDKIFRKTKEHLSIKGSIELSNLYIRFFWTADISLVKQNRCVLQCQRAWKHSSLFCILLGKECSLNYPSLDKTRNGGGSCMFNSLAYNCDFQDAIGNHVSDNTSLSLSIKEKKLKIKSFPPSRRCTRGSLLGFKLPGKKKWWLPISQKFPKDLP